MIELDLTLFIQLVNFLITMVVLNVLLIRPVREIIRKRREMAAGFLSDAERFAAEADERLERYEAALAKAREQGARDREAYKTAALRREADLLASAHADAQDFLQRAREETRQAIADASQELRNAVPGLGAQAARRLLSGGVRAKG